MLTQTLFLFYPCFSLLCQLLKMQRSFMSKSALPCNVFISHFDWLHLALPQTKFSIGVLHFGNLKAMDRWGWRRWWKGNTIKCGTWNPAKSQLSPRKNLSSLTGSIHFTHLAVSANCRLPGIPGTHHNTTSTAAGCLTGHLSTERRRRYTGKHTI